MKKAKLKANPSHEHECKTLELRKYQDIKSYRIKGMIKQGLDAEKSSPGGLVVENTPAVQETWI